MTMSKNFIFEGPEVGAKNASGKSIMHGWRNYKVVLNGRAANCVGLPGAMRKAAGHYNATFYERGTWEAGPGCGASGWAQIKPEIMAQMEAGK
jgi:hypothetical protein